MLVLENTPRQAIRLQQATVAVAEVSNGGAKMELILAMEDSEEGLKGFWTYSTDLFDQATLSRMTHHFQRLLAAMADAR